MHGLGRWSRRADVPLAGVCGRPSTICRSRSGAFLLASGPQLFLCPHVPSRSSTGGGPTTTLCSDLPPPWRQRLRLGGGTGKKIKISAKARKKQKHCDKHRKKFQKYIKRSILEELGNNRWRHQILREKIPYADLCSSLYDRKWPMCVHVRNCSYISTSYDVVSSQ